MWLTFTVLWDGRVSLCCADYDGRNVLGDLRTSTIADIWNSQAYRAVRRQHLESGGPEICRSCDLPKKDSPLWVGKLLWSRRGPPGPGRLDYLVPVRRRGGEPARLRYQGCTPLHGIHSRRARAAPRTGVYLRHPCTSCD